MSYTDRFFEFPIRIYDGFSLEKAWRREDEKLRTSLEDIDEPEKGDWVKGKVRLPHKEIICWMDHFEEGTPVSDVSDKGFEMTLVLTKKLGTFECMWKKERFEQELNKFIDRDNSTTN